MKSLFFSPAFGICLTIFAYVLAGRLRKRTGSPLCNEMLLTVLMIMGVLTIFHIPYEAYDQGGSVISLFLGPATACLALGIYRKRELLKKNWLPVLLGSAAGVLTSVGSIWGLSRLFGLDREMTASLLPKSVTTPIAAAVSQGHGGIVPITVAAVIFTGILGNVCAPLLIRLFHVKDPLAAGLGIGACSHGIGTAKAMELGETQGAMSSLAIGICGLLTALLALGFELIL